MGMNVLLWISHAKRPLAVAELSDALSTKTGSKTPRPRHRPSERAMLRCCFGLASKNAKTGTIGPAHGAIKRYLVANSGTLFPDGAARVANACLTYLLYDEPAWAVLDTESELRARAAAHPFLSYASEWWGVHAQTATPDPDVEKRAWALLLSETAGPVVSQVIGFDCGYRERYWTRRESYSHTPLHVAAKAAFPSGVRRLLERSDADLDAKTTIGTTPVVKTSCVECAKILLAYGADPTVPNWYGDALHCAAESNNDAMIRTLVVAGRMDPNVYKSMKDSPLYCTLDRDSVEAFTTLIELGARLPLRAAGTDGEDFFVAAIEYHCHQIVDDMLRRGLVDLASRDRDGATYLHFAAEKRNRVAVERLVDAGADIYAADDRGRTPAGILREAGAEDRQDRIKRRSRKDKQ